jgi:hypothetical protein
VGGKAVGWGHYQNKVAWGDRCMSLGVLLNCELYASQLSWERYKLNKTCLLLSVWPYNNVFSYPRFRIYCFHKPHHPFVWNSDHKRWNITNSKPPGLIHLGFDFWELFPFAKIWKRKKMFLLVNFGVTHHGFWFWN